MHSLPPIFYFACPNSHALILSRSVRLIIILNTNPDHHSKPNGNYDCNAILNPNHDFDPNLNVNPDLCYYRRTEQYRENAVKIAGEYTQQVYNVRYSAFTIEFIIMLK